VLACLSLDSLDEEDEVLLAVAEEVRTNRFFVGNYHITT
jgi:hypothetical protein